MMFRYDEVQSYKNLDKSFDGMIEAAWEHYKVRNFDDACEQLRTCIYHYKDLESMLFLGKLLVQVALEKTGNEKDTPEKEAIKVLRNAAYTDVSKPCNKEAEDVLFRLYLDRQPFYGNPLDMQPREEDNWNAWVTKAKYGTALDQPNTRYYSPSSSRITGGTLPY